MGEARMMYFLVPLLAAACVLRATVAMALAPLPRLNIKRGGVVAAGFANAGDFAHQLHIAYSSMVDASCVFAGQPYHCATSHFSRDVLVAQTSDSPVPHCDGCPFGKTLTFDHCKQHPEWVDVGQLPDYPRRACGQNPITKTECIDDPANLFDDRVYLFRGTQDEKYLPGAVANTQALLAQMLTDPEHQLKFVDDQPFPHTMPTNATPFDSEDSPSGFDGPGECLRWVYPDLQHTAGVFNETHLIKYDQSPFMDDIGVGVNAHGFVYVPEECNSSLASGLPPCRLVVLADGCSNDFEPMDFAKYAETNNLVLLQPCVGGFVNMTRFPHAKAVSSGLLDVYGQLSGDYAMQSSPHMKFVGRVLRHLAGW